MSDPRKPAFEKIAPDAPHCTRRGAEIVEFRPVSGDIAAAMRVVADEIEAGIHPNLRFAVAVFVDTDDSFTAYGWGQLSNLEAIGALSQAAAKGLVDV